MAAVIGALVLVAALLVVCALALGWLPTHVEYCEQNPQTNHKECATYYIALVAVWQVGKFLDAIAVPLTALATVAIGYFTFTLKASTDRLWIAGEKARKLSEDTSKKQLRAYVHAAGVTILYADSEWCPNIRIRFKNYGQTPAHKVSNRFGTALAIIGEPNFNLPDTIARHTDLGPSQDQTTTMIIARSVWEPLLKPAIKGRAAPFFVFGQIAYFDAFQDRTSDTPHITRYRFQLQIDDEGVPGFLFSDEGNDSD